MHIEFSFSTHDHARHSRPWFGVIKGWPDKGPPSMAFGKLVKGSNPPKAMVPANPGDIVRWGCKSLATGQADPALSGFGMVSPTGTVVPLSQEDAKAARRRAHPEDATLAPVAIKGGGSWRGGKNTGPAQASLAGSQAVHYAALIAAAQKACDTWTAHVRGGMDGMPFAEAINALAELLPGAAQAQAETQPVPVPVPVPEVEDENENEDEAPAPAAPTVPAVDEDGLPLF
jgi:hypothetical protein